MQRVAVIASASGNGKTTLARRVAERLGAPFIELDSIVHGPNWLEISDEELRAHLAPILAGERWVIDGDYARKLGTLVIDAADLIVWLDLPIRVWLPRLVRRSHRRWLGSEPLWNGNRETLTTLIWSWDSLFVYALRMHFRRRREWPGLLAGRSVVRLRRPIDVERFLSALSSPG